MRAVIVYPVPCDQWHTFAPFVQRFAQTFREFPPGIDYELRAVCNWGEPTDELRNWFRGTKVMFDEYYGNGCDIGSAQRVAGNSPDAFIIAMTSRCYFHREGWLRRYMEARQKFGPGLYGASASWEGGRPHICTRAYAMDGKLWERYPHDIDTREKGQKFEVGEWCVSDWVHGQNLPLVQVTWDGEQLYPNWRPNSEQGIYRRGEQAAMLVWDKHTDAYKNAEPEEKIRLQKMADPQ